MKSYYCVCRDRERIPNGARPDRCFRCTLPLRPEHRPKQPASK